MSVRLVVDRRPVVRQAMRRAAAEALNAAAEVLLEEANQSVPIEEGTLLRSGMVEPADPGDLVASVGYGGEASAYAVKQHEDTSLRHDPGRTPKWLQNAARDFAPRFESWVGTRVRGRL